MKTRFNKTILLLASLIFTLCSVAMQTDDTSKEKALVTLENKCNVCHRSRNPGKIFTLNNMDGFAPGIYKQVFVKKRMPRGNTIKLDQKDRQALMNWLKTLNPGN